MATTKTTTKKAAAKKPAAAKTTPGKATGAHIPPPPGTAAAVAASTANKGGPDGSPGSTLNPSDPNAPNYRFTPQGQDTAAGLEGADKGGSVQPPMPVLDPTPAGGSGEAADGRTWLDEHTALGRRIALTGGSGDEGSATTTHEEVIPHGATEADAEAARERIRRKIAA